MRFFFSVMVVIAVLGASGPLPAAEKKSDGASAQLRRMEQMQRKLAEDKAQLVQEKSTLEQEVKKLSDEAAELKKAADAASRKRALAEKELAKLQQDAQRARHDQERERAALAQRLETAEKRIAALSDQGTTAAATLQTRETDLKTLQGRFGTQTDELKRCESKNHKIQGLCVELLDRYQRKTALDSLRAAEPFTGLKAVEIENIVEEYRRTLEAEKYVSPAR